MARCGACLCGSRAVCAIVGAVMPAAQAPDFTPAGARLLVSECERVKDMRRLRSVSRPIAEILEQALRTRRHLAMPADFAAGNSAAAQRVRMVLAHHCKSILHRRDGRPAKFKCMTATAERIHRAARFAAGQPEHTRAGRCSTAQEGVSGSRREPRTQPDRVRPRAAKRSMNGLAPALAADEAMLSTRVGCEIVDGIEVEEWAPTIEDWAVAGCVRSVRQRLDDVLETRPTRRDGHCRTMASRKKSLEAWGFRDALELGQRALVQFSRVSRAAAASVMDAERASAYLHIESAGTLMASAGLQFMVIQRGSRGLSARMSTPGETASLVQVPEAHPIREGLKAVTPCEARRLCGKGVNCESAAKIWRMGLEWAGVEEQFTVGIAGSGLSLVAAGLDLAAPGRWSYQHFVEEDEEAIKAHRAAWTGPQWYRCVQEESYTQEAPPVDAWQYSPQCEPFAPDNVGPPSDVEPELAVIQAALRYPARTRPKLIVIEETGALMRACLRDERMRIECMLLRVGPYKWRRVQECPSDHSGALAARPRLWYVGKLEAEA